MIYPFHPPAEDVHPSDEAQLALYARGDISARECMRRILQRLSVPIPESLLGERDAAPLTQSPATSPDKPVGADRETRSPSTMSEDTAMIITGELQIADWLVRAERKYGQLLGP